MKNCLHCVRMKRWHEERPSLKRWSTLIYFGNRMCVCGPNHLNSLLELSLPAANCWQSLWRWPPRLLRTNKIFNSKNISPNIGHRSVDSGWTANWMKTQIKKLWRLKMYIQMHTQMPKTRTYRLNNVDSTMPIWSDANLQSGLPASTAGLKDEKFGMEKFHTKSPSTG